MNAREFFDAVVRMRASDKAYYACKASFPDPHKQELYKAAIEAERVVDKEIERVESILLKQKEKQTKLFENDEK